MIVLILLLYGVPVYLIFFHYRLIPLTVFWKVFLGIPPTFILVFLWFALGRYTPTTQNAYVQAPVVQVVSEVGGLVTEVAVKDHQVVRRGATLFQVDPRPYQYRVDQANARLVDVQENALTLFGGVYAAEESIREAEANLLVAQQNAAAAVKDLETAKKTATEATTQLELAERSAQRTAQLTAKNAASQDDYEKSLRDVANQRALWVDAQNRVSQAETALEVASLQSMLNGVSLGNRHSMRNEDDLAATLSRPTLCP